MLNFQKVFFYSMIVEYNGFLMSVLSLGLAQISSDERGVEPGPGELTCSHELTYSHDLR